MGNSLGEQLLKAGLVDEKQVRNGDKAKRNRARQHRKGQNAPGDPAKLAAQRAQAEQVARDRKLNRQRNEEAHQRTVAAQVRQLIESNRLADQEEGDTPYNFTDGSRIKRIHVSERTRRALADGRLAIVRLDRHYELVPVAAAEKIRQRCADCVISLNVPSAQQKQDDYAGYEVPDDLMW